MRVVSKGTLTAFWTQPRYADSESPLRAWHAETERSVWKNFADIKQSHRYADAVGNNRVIFNMGGNKYRLVVAVGYETGFVLIKFVGTHEQYDNINPETVERADWQ